MKTARSTLLALALPAIAALLLSTAPLAALSYVPAADTELADRADLIVHGRLVSATVKATSDGIMTEYAFEPLTHYKGAALGVSEGDTLRVMVLGGTLPDGSGTVIHGLPRFRAGQEALLFLRPFGDDYRIVHMMQGVFYRAEQDGVAYWRRTGETAGHQVAAKGSLRAKAAAEFGQARDAERFTHWLTDRANGIDRPADYFAPDRTPAIERPIAKFTLLTTTPRIRWFEFNRGDVVFWHRHTDGLDGVPDRGVTAFRNGRDAWNNEPNTPIRLFPAPDTSSSTGFNSSDGQNVILWSDLNDDIDTDFVCGQAGTLAIGGFSFIAGGGLRIDWKGDPYAVAVEAEIVVNTGFSCFAQSDPLATEQVLAHELGHTLGLGHSCGDDDSPACEGRPSLANALMTAFIGRPFFGALLRQDDIAGARWLYDPSFFDQRPGEVGDACNLPPGHPRFCSTPGCAPCQNGQGDCDRDSECAAGLTCVQNVGAQFGFSPGIDVCTGGDVGPPPPGPCPLSPGNGRYCSDPRCGPCGNGLGDCDNDAECAPGFQCVDNVGAQFGFAPGVDVCLPGGPPVMCTSTNGRGNFCSTPGCGPCQSGEGDCDSDAECAPGLRCVEDIGPQFGFGARVDVCQ